MNIEKLDRAIDWIRENPQRHDQGYWAVRTSCGTTMCLAGVVVSLDGWSLQFRSNGTANQVTSPNGGMPLSISEIAQRILGLDDQQAFDLFWGGNRIEDIVRLRDFWAGRD